MFEFTITPLSDLETLSTFADDNFTIKINHDLLTLITLIETSLNNTCKWLEDSGLTVNKGKTEVCLFSKRDVAPFNIIIGGSPVTTSKTINVLGLVFDSKLTWGPQVTNALSKSSRALTAIRLISRFFNRKELIQLVTSNYYSILFYNSEVWHLNNLKYQLKNSLLTASAKALKVCLKNYDPYISYENLHKMAKRAVPEKLMMYKLSLQLHKTYNHQTPIIDWLYLNDNIILTSRQLKFKIAQHNRLRVGVNALSSRFWFLNDKIDLNYLSLSFDTFKIKMKELFITT